MTILVLVLPLFIVGGVCKQSEGFTKYEQSKQLYGVNQNKNEPTNLSCENEAWFYLDKMPKRTRPQVPKKSKKSKHLYRPNASANMRTPIPRNCKLSGSSPPKSSSYFRGNFPCDFANDLFSLPYERSLIGSNQKKVSEKDKNSKKNKKDTEKVDWSSDELDVVYDVKEEKKNKIYEVITVMSDDETPNTVTYEKIYAEDDKKTVSEEEIAKLFGKPSSDVKSGTDVVEDVVKELSTITNNAKSGNDVVGDLLTNTVKNGNDVVGDVIKELATIKNTLINKDMAEHSNNTIDISSQTVVSNLEQNSGCSSVVNVESKEDSDDDVVCLAVLDAKTKAEMKKASIEEICLSSDSDTESSRPTVPPIRLKIPRRSVTNWTGLFQNDGSESSFGSNRTRLSYGFSRRPYLSVSPSKKRTDKLNSVSDCESYSSSPKLDEFCQLSPMDVELPKLFSSDESSLDESEPDLKISTSSLNENSSSSSSDSSSDEEEKDIYWKANMHIRRKSQLMCEEFTDFGRKVHEGEAVIDTHTTFTFKVMSHNVLAQNLLEEHRFLYKDHDRRALGWARRWALIYKDIKDESPEILCLQEVEESFLFTHYSKLQDLGYKWVYKKRTNQYKEGVAVFYKAAVFQSEAVAKVEYFQPGVSVLDRDNVGVVVKLRLKNHPNHAIVVATTHLLYNPRRSDVKLAQVQMLFAEIDRLAYNKDAMTYYPIILTGDFNLKPHNGVYRLITEGVLKYEGMSRRSLGDADSNLLPKTLLPARLGITDRCQHAQVLDARVRDEDAISTRLYNSELNRDPEQEECTNDDRFESGTLTHAFNFQSVYPHVKEDGQKEASTHHDNWVTVDYIFYSAPKTKEEGLLQLLSRVRLPTQEECERLISHLPNFAFGSDHLPLAAKFLLHLQ